jgi:hypothetical protein
MQSTAKKFLARFIALTVVFYGMVAGASFLFDHWIDWRPRQNPRERLLWDDRSREADIVVLGDSVFISSYVNSSEDSLANLIHDRTGKAVFAGALDGADSADFVNAARLLQRNGNKGTDVILDVIPTRFLPRKHPEHPAGNYPGQFGTLVGDNMATGVLARLRRPLLLLDFDVVMNTVLRRRWYGTGNYRDRIWNKDGDLARSRFEGFEQELICSDELGDFSWIETMDRLLKEDGNRLVLFLTASNFALLHEYATPENASKYEALIIAEHKALMRYLQRNHLEYINAFDVADPSTFVDLIHINARGNRVVADLIATHLASSLTRNNIN